MRLPIGYFFAFVTFLMAGCANDPGTLGLERGGLATDFGVVVVDTTTVAVSTVLLDSVPTSDLGLLLVGGYKDDKLGRLSAEGYAQIGNNGSWTPPPLATFDSIVMIAHFNKYSYGDTTISQTLEVKRIVEPFRVYALPQFWINEGQYSVLYTAGAKYNTSTIRTDPTPLGSRTFRFRPHSTDTIVVRMPDQIGMDWLALAKENSPKIQDQGNFIEYFKGISIASVSPDPGAIVGLNTDKLRLRIYFKSYVNEKLVQQFRDFPFTSGLYNYSRITSDRSGTILDPLKKRQEAISSVVTGNEAFVQSGIGIATKLTFPYMTNLLRQSDALLINQAQLILVPIKEAYSDAYPLPKNLTIFETDQTNLPLLREPANYGASSSAQSAYISFDKEYDSSTGYVFTLTQYFNFHLSHDFNRNTGLLIMPPPDELSKTVNKIQFGGGSGKYRVKLKIWYTYKK